MCELLLFSLLVDNKPIRNDTCKDVKPPQAYSKNYIRTKHMIVAKMTNISMCLIYPIVFIDREKSAQLRELYCKHFFLLSFASKWLKWSLLFCSWYCFKQVFLLRFLNVINWRNKSHYKYHIQCKLQSELKIGIYPNNLVHNGILP